MSKAIRTLLTICLSFLLGFSALAEEFGLNCRQSLEPLSERALNKADITQYRLGDRLFKQGDIVDFYFKPELSEKPSLESAAQIGHSAIFVGAFEARSRLLLVFDLGRGRIRSVDSEKVDRILPSTAQLKPSKGTPLEKIVMISRMTYRTVSRFVVPGALKTLPTLTAVLASAYLGKEAIEFAWDFSRENVLIAGGTGALMLTLATNKKTQTDLKFYGQLALEGFWNISKLAGHMIRFSIRAPFRLGKVFHEFKTHLGMIGLGILDRQSRKDGKPVAPERGSESEFIENSRMIAIPAKDSKDPEGFVNRSRQLFREGYEFSEYLWDIGLPVLEATYKPSIWFIEQPAKISANGPMAYGPGTVLMTPVKVGPIASLKARLQGKTGFPAQQRVIEDIWRREILMHELTHVNLFLGYDFDVIGRFLHEALSDYFPNSYLDRKVPIVGEGLISGMNIREGIRRDDYSEAESPRLNYNSPAQFKGGSHKDAQVLFRFLWELRRRHGRELVDPMIASSLKYVRSVRKTDYWGSTPNNDGIEGDPLSLNSNLKDSYAFITSLVVEAKTGNKVPPADVIELASEFGFSTEAIAHLLTVFKGIIEVSYDSF